jgi:uncharacterized membrane protein YccF (DUF307 family)
MKAILRVLGGLWTAFGWMLLIAVGLHMGVQIGYGRGARDTARLIHEMRQGAYETPEPWDSGGI